MLHNDNELDQLFRDRLRDHTSPVRPDLWRRIHSGLGTPARRLHLLRNGRYLAAAAMTITVAFAAHLIFTPAHPSHPSHPSVPPVSHYSAISAGASGRPDTVALSPGLIGTTARADLVTPIGENPASKKHNTPPSRAASSTTTGAPTSGNTAAAVFTAAGASTAAGVPIHHQPVTLPAIASTSTRAAIPARPLTLKPRHNDPTIVAAAPRRTKTGYISLYGSVDFPSNHYYTWSGALGGTVTIPFNRHWSGTAGLEYGRVDVPTQIVPPIISSDTLHAFHFSNYEVPVLIGYTMMLGSYALTVNGGAILNIHSHQSNSPGNQVTSSTSTWVFNWPNRDSYGAYLGADIFRPLGHSIRFFAQPYARYSISNYRMFIPVQRFFYGAHLGIRYAL